MTALDLQKRISSQVFKLGPLLKIKSFDTHYVTGSQVDSIDGYACRIDDNDTRGQ
jgi:hypothetical protein